MSIDFLVQLEDLEGKGRIVPSLHPSQGSWDSPAETRGNLGQGIDHGEVSLHEIYFEGKSERTQGRLDAGMKEKKEFEEILVFHGLAVGWSMLLWNEVEGKQGVG